MPIVPFSLRDAPSFLERAFPAQRISIEAQAERKANSGQTLTPLGSYWKGRKPLVLARACIIGSLLPATEHPEEDLEVFELLMAMDDAAFAHRAKKVSVSDVEAYGGDVAKQLLDPDGKWGVKGIAKQRLLGRVLTRMPYSMRLDKRSLRPEECPNDIYDGIWDRVNSHVGTNAHSHSELVEQLGIMRFGHRPKVADTFAGGGSIPFEAARLGCDVYASDLNPIACMLTWASLNVIGADNATRLSFQAEQENVVNAVDAEIGRLGVEHSKEGYRAKAYLYCLEATCPETGWSVPLAPSWIVSHSQRSVAILVANQHAKRFDIVIQSGVDEEVFEAARNGTIQGGDMVYTLKAVEHRIPIRTLRGDRRAPAGAGENALRQWAKGDVAPRGDDIFRERLYCVHWSLPGGATLFRAPDQHDLETESRIESLVSSSLAEWQERGWVPDMSIEAGSETSRLSRERGWTHWHHLFRPREVLAFALWRQHARHPINHLMLASLLDLSSKLCQWLTAPTGKAGGARDLPNHVFYNQSLNPFFNFAIRSFDFHRKTLATRRASRSLMPPVDAIVVTRAAADVGIQNDIYITDPPYADAVAYEEITEFFIAWLRKNPPGPFADWTWDSRRELAVKGSGDAFRREMVRAYSAMTKHMPDNGLQIVMFTHQDGGVWADMANIFWGAGLKVTAAWYIATETTSELKKGGYVQGTVILVLRKRMGSATTYTNEVVEEVRREVAHQIETLTGLNQVTRAGRDENLFNDADLQMAGYAAALRVLTAYTHIDDQDMTREALRPRVKGEKTLADRIIDHSVQIANEYLVPEGLDAKIWDRLNGSERFYLRMLDVEEAGAKKLDGYQNFAKAFKVRDFGVLMASQKPNNARLKSAEELKKSEFAETEFGTSTLRAVLFALHELQGEMEPDEVLSHLRDTVKDYMRKRELVVALARYVGLKLAELRPAEAEAARVLTGLVKNERVGG
jgi:adenine-specific DNA methylase